jgi:hypothetical protein
MTEPDDAQWRDPDKLPLTELDRAMATYSFDGQVDDLTGGDAGAEDEFGDDPDVIEGRPMRPGPDGRQGPV